MSPILELLILAGLTALVRLWLLKPAEPPTAAGAAVMAVGIFAIGALQRLPAPFPATTPLIAIELLIVWAYIAWRLVASYVKGTFRVHVDDPLGCFAIGTWVAGTTVLATVVNVSIPEWRTLAITLDIAGLFIWVWYMWVITHKFREVAFGGARVRVTGRILLSTVSTQALLVAAEQIFPGQTPPLISIGIMALGALYYFAGLALIVRRYVLQKGWRLADEWDNTNCIIHGAVSITGLASVHSGLVPLEVMVAMWVWAALMLVVVEAIEVARMWVRVREYGWKRGVFTYNVSQWARNFTFGMFYTFTLHMWVLLGGVAAPEAAWLVAAQEVVVVWGPWVVLFFLLAEIGLFFLDNIRQKTQEAKSGILARRDAESAGASQGF
jgi:hypothetical protein